MKPGYVTFYRLEERATNKDGKPITHFVRVNGKGLDRVTFAAGFLAGRVFEWTGALTEGGWRVMKEV